MNAEKYDMCANSLEDLYKESLLEIVGNKPPVIIDIKCDNVDYMLKHIDKNKSIFGALITSLVKKVIDPDQDVRLHRKNFNGGYSARTLDTKVTTPFLLRNFPRYANKESSFLTMATRESVKWDLIEGMEIKMRDDNLKISFLTILDDVQRYPVKSQIYIRYIIYRLIQLTQTDNILYSDVLNKIPDKPVITIEALIELLSEHFKSHNSSRLPVIAIWTVYQLFEQTMKRYDGKMLQKLNVQTSSDRKGFADIEILDENSNPFEGVEVKHNIPIDLDLILNIEKKVSQFNIDRYYVLTTYASCFRSTDQEKEICEYIRNLKMKSGIEIVTNGILQSLKYYFRLLDDYKIFIKIYTKNLIDDAKNSTEVTNEHVKNWYELIKPFSKQT